MTVPAALGKQCAASTGRALADDKSNDLLSELKSTGVTALSPKAPAGLSVEASGPAGPNVTFREVSEREAVLYYDGLGSTRAEGPKLIYRTSSDTFVEPLNGGYRREMRLTGVEKEHKLGEDGLWDTICDIFVVEVFDINSIKFSSIDFVRFTCRWVNSNIEVTVPVEDIDCYTTPPTVWIGVLPNTLSSELAYKAAVEILEILKQHNISGVDVAFRESVVRSLSGPGPALFGPACDITKQFIDHLSTPLSLPIADLKSMSQGTLGFYFRDKHSDLYAVTARHVLFEAHEGNNMYRYADGHKKHVIVLGDLGFDDYLASIMEAINSLKGNAGLHAGPIERLEMKMAEVAQDSPEAQNMAQRLERQRKVQANILGNMALLQDFYQELTQSWSKPEDRIIGYVHWAPPIEVGVRPHCYTQDLCILKLDKRKFKNFVGNTLSLGSEIPKDAFKNLMNNPVDEDPEFEYPPNGLLPLRGILSVAKINRPGVMGKPECMPRVIKRGYSTLTTVGQVCEFSSVVRKYNELGSNNIQSREVLILPHSSLDEFSLGGDSGSLIVDARGRFVGLLTGGDDLSRTTYATPMEWLWALIQAEYDGASLEFDDLETFMSQPKSFNLRLLFPSPLLHNTCSTVIWLLKMAAHLFFGLRLLIPSPLLYNPFQILKWLLATAIHLFFGLCLLFLSPLLYIVWPIVKWLVATATHLLLAALANFIGKYLL
ncbi:hypothetical protein BC835DRAFT_1424251 [Cytidiella melzeri]|nr:hypothetical protein BC835DRAFT_1424251 [Cytidiella melzeri]